MRPHTDSSDRLRIGRPLGGVTALVVAWAALISIIAGALVLGRLYPPSPAPSAVFTFRLDWTPPRAPSSPARTEVSAAAPDATPEPAVPTGVESLPETPATTASAPEIPAPHEVNSNVATRSLETGEAAPSPTLESPAPVSAAPIVLLAQPEPNTPALHAPDRAAVVLTPPIPAGQTPARSPVLPGVALSSPPRLQNLRPFDAKERRPRIALVMIDLGVKPAASEAAIARLPGEVTLAVSAYADDGPRFVREARAAGHEVLLTVAMEPASFPTAEAGPETLLVAAPPQENLKRLTATLGHNAGYVGVTYAMGGRFTTEREALQPVLTALRDRGLLFFDGRASPRSVAHELAGEIGLAQARADRIIDAEPTRSAIDARFDEIEAIARDAGLAVAVAHPYPVTFERLLIWLPTLARKGFALAPVSAARPRTPPVQPMTQPENAK